MLLSELGAHALNASNDGLQVTVVSCSIKRTGSLQIPTIGVREVGKVIVGIITGVL